MEPRVWLQYPRVGTWKRKKNYQTQLPNTSYTSLQKAVKCNTFQDNSSAIAYKVIIRVEMRRWQCKQEMTTKHLILLSLTIITLHSHKDQSSIEQLISTKLCSGTKHEFQLSHLSLMLRLSTQSFQSSGHTQRSLQPQWPVRHRQ